MNIIKFFSRITIEPCVALFMVGVNLTNLANLNLLLEKTCRVNLGHSDELCHDLISRNDNSSRDLTVEVQRYVSEMLSVGKLLQVIIPFIAILLWGLWSDRNHRRKPLILLPMAGEVLKNLCLIICVWVPHSNAEIAFAVESVFPLVFGNWTVILLGVYSHVMDTTTKENRTTKVASTSILVTIGDPLGSALSGVLLKVFGYYAVFGISALLMFIGMMYCLFWVKECVHVEGDPSTGGSPATTNENGDSGTEYPKRSCLGLSMDFFNFAKIGGIFKVIYTKRTGNKKLMLWLGYSVVIFGLGPNLGHYSVQYFFARHQFNFDEIDYSLFGTISSVSGTIGLILIMFLNNKLLHLNDYALSMVGLSFGIVSSITFGMSQISRDFYIAAAIDSGFGAFVVALRAAMMKLVEPNETGKSNAILGAAEGSLFLLFGSLYNYIYSVTVDQLAGAFYLVSAACFTYSLVVMVGLYLMQKRTQRNSLGMSTETVESTVDIKL